MHWVIQEAKGGRADGGAFDLAANWLVRHFGDDPDAVRVGLQLNNWPRFERDNLLLCFYASAKGRESKGLARLALAQYLQHKAMMAKWARTVEGRVTYTHDDLVRADGTLYSEKQVQSDEEYAYLLHLKQCDVDYLRTEAERLYEEVIAEYGDVPYIRARDRRLEALLRQPEPRWNGEPLTAEDRRRIEARLARRSMLGQVAEARLDDWHNLAVGKSAPEIEGVDVHGKPLKLSDYRGKVVALVFWGTWCGPCMREIPREKSLAERMRGRPFAMLGVNTDADAGAARKVMEAQGVAWPNWHDGEPGEGPIAKLYHVRGYPTVYVIDAEGKIRSKRSLGNELDQLVETLVAEQEAAGD
jgi:thiol-disulfide isomerase/thioredoxin